MADVLQTMDDKQLSFLRKKCLRSFYCFSVMVMGYNDITISLHDKYCRFLSSASQRKQATMPRSFVKTWLGSVAYPIWVTLNRNAEDEFPYEGASKDKFGNLVRI